MRNLKYTNIDGTIFDFNQYMTIENVEGIDTPKLEISKQKAPFQNGETYLDGKYASREIVIQGKLHELDITLLPQIKAEIYSKLNPLNQGFKPLTSSTTSTKELKYGTLSYAVDGVTYDKHIDGIPISCLFANKLSSEGFQNILIRINCPDPFWYGTEITETMERLVALPGGSYASMADNTTTAVLVGSSVCATSTDGIKWTSRTIPAGSYTKVVWTGSLFVAVGASTVCATSPDGITWTSRTIPTGSYNDIVWSGSLLVAVGTSTVCATSPDGITWTARTITTGSYEGVTWSGTLFVAVGATGACSSSPDGITWTSRSIGSTAQFRAVTWSGSLFVAVSLSDTYSTSADGITWTSRTLFGSGWLDIIYGGGLFLATGFSYCAISANGTTWTDVSFEGISRLAYYWNSKYYCIGTTLYTSSNGTTWAYYNKMTCDRVNKLKKIGTKYFGPSLDYGALHYSENSLSWQYIYIDAQNQLIKDIAYSGSLYIATKASTTQFLKSSDGITWTEQAIGTTGSYTPIIWAQNKFTALRQNGLVWSTDGLTWTNGTSITGTFTDMIYTWQYVAVGTSACATSIDGLTWTSRTIPTGNYNSLVWTGSLYVAVGNSTKCATSPDGITWTARTIPTGDYKSVEWSGSLLIAVGNSGVCSSSPDGITWTTRTVGPTTNLSSVIYDENIFVVTGDYIGTYKSYDGINWFTETSSDYVKTFTVSGDTDTPILAEIPIVGFESSKTITLSDGVIWDGVGTPPNTKTIAVNSSDFPPSTISIETAFGKKSIRRDGENIMYRYIGGTFFSIEPGEHSFNVRNSGEDGGTPTIKYKPRYLGV